MPVRVYKSSMPGAPVMSGTVGALIGVLDACLVNGLASQAITSITRSGNTATVTSTAAHLLTTGDLVSITGAIQTDYNVEAYVTVTGASTFTYTVANSPATPATGLPVFRIAGAGWTKAFSGTNLAAYRAPIGTTNGFYCRVDDSVALYSRIRGYETMTDVSTGTGLFPTDAQLSGGSYHVKSNAASGAGRSWVLITNGKIWYFLNYYLGTIAQGVNGISFGDPTNYKTGDLYGTILFADTQTSTPAVFQAMVASITSQAGHFLARSYTQIGTSVAIGKSTDAAKTSSAAVIGAAGMTYPVPADGGLYLAPVYWHEPGCMRGVLPGIWAPCHARPLTDLDTFSGSGDLAGKTFLACNTVGTGQMFLETSNTW